jgi:glycine cleavage system H protein
MEFRDELRYTRDHEWVRRSGEEFLVGITDYAQSQLSDIVYVELPAAGDALRQGEPFGSVEAVKAVADLFAPLSGEVLEANAALGDDPALLNREPYDGGWIVRGRLSDPAEWEGLLTAEQYRRLVGELAGAGA